MIGICRRLLVEVLVTVVERLVLFVEPLHFAASHLEHLALPRFVRVVVLIE